MLGEGAANAINESVGTVGKKLVLISLKQIKTFIELTLQWR